MDSTLFIFMENVNNLNFGRLIKLLHWRLRQGANAVLKDYNITSAQAELLAYLQRNKDRRIIQKDIEEAFKISNPTASGLLNRLEAKGFIIRETSKEDKRKKVVLLAENALSLDKAVKVKFHEKEDELLSRLSVDEQEELLNMLRRMAIKE